MTDTPARAPVALWAALAGLALAGFCFGVWAGNQRPQTVEVVRNEPPPVKDDAAVKPAPDPAPEPVKESPRPEPKKLAQAPKKGPAAKKDKDERVAMAEPKKEPEPEPKPPEPKKVEPKKGEPKAPAVTFVKDVLPVFRANCNNCHAGKNAKGGIDLTTLAGAVRGGDSGTGVKPNDPDGSPVWQQVESGSMPPGKKLADKDMKLIKAWIEAGAK